MDDQEWERLKRRARFDTWWNRGAWAFFVANALCGALEGLTGHFTKAFISGLVMALCYFAIRWEPTLAKIKGIEGNG